MMYVDQRYAQYFGWFEQRMRWLEKRQDDLEAENRRLKELLQQIKPVHIENIHYKIQELTVKELSGALNIGLTAPADREQLKRILEQGQEGIQMENMSDADSTFQSPTSDNG